MHIYIYVYTHNNTTTTTTTNNDNDNNEANNRGGWAVEPLVLAWEVMPASLRRGSLTQQEARLHPRRSSSAQKSYT